MYNGIYNAKTANLFCFFAFFSQKRLIKCKGGDIINRKTGGMEDLVMLLEFSCSNHKSILDKVIFSALAGKDTSHEERVKIFDSFRVLKGAIIYGANGSGKSNFIDAISFVKNLVSDSIMHQPGQDHISWQKQGKVHILFNLLNQILGMHMVSF